MNYNPPRFGLTDGEPDGNLDPYILALWEELEGSPERPASPQPSGHLWAAAVPENLGPGIHKVTIKSTDPYGRVSQTSQRFEIAKDRQGG